MRKSALVLCLLAASAALRADVTIKYDMKFTTSPIIPAQALAPLTSALSQGVTVQLKDGKGRTSLAGATSLLDYTTQEFTLVDDANKRYTTVAIKDYLGLIASAIPTLPDAAKQLMAGMKFTVAPGDTKKTATILGMNAEGKESTITMTMAMPAGLPAPPQGIPPMSFKMTVYTVGQTQAALTPGLWEYAGYLATANQTTMGAVKQVLSFLPGLGDSLGPLFADMTDPSRVMLQFEMEMGAGMLGPDPLMKISQTMTQLTPGTLDASLFQIPPGYQKVEAAAFMSALTNAVKQAGAAPEAAR